MWFTINDAAGIALYFSKSSLNKYNSIKVAYTENNDICCATDIDRSAMSPVKKKDEQTSLDKHYAFTVSLIFLE